MLELDIPGFGAIRAEHLVIDFTGTLSVGGRLIPCVREQLTSLAGSLKIHVVSSDTFGTVRTALEGLPCVIRVLSGTDHDVQKENYAKGLDPLKVIAIGNGKNDRRLLKAARIGIAVAEGEGCAVDALLSADIHVRSVSEGLNLLLEPERLMATLRY